MGKIDRFADFSVAEQRLLAIVDELSATNEGVIDAVTGWFERFNDGIRELMLTMLEKGLSAIGSMKRFFGAVLGRIVAFKESHPVLFRIIVGVLVLAVLAFVLCSAAASSDKKPSPYVIDMAIGLLEEIRKRGNSEIENSVMMKAQAYLFEIKKTGKEIPLGTNVVKAAEAALKIVEEDISQYKSSPENKEENAKYLLNLAQEGAKLVGYRIKQYADAITGQSSGETINLEYRR
jgi:hypothetical protein